MLAFEKHSGLGEPWVRPYRCQVKLATVPGVHKMRDEKKTRKQLVNELVELRQRVAGLVKVEAGHKWAEELQESQAKYSALVERAKDGVFIVQDGIIKFANRAVANISGYAVEELIGVPLKERLATESKHAIVQRHKLRLAGKQVPPVYETKVRCNDGTVKDAELSTSVIQYEGKPADMGIIRDITERKRMEEALCQSEERFRGIVERSFDAIVMIDLEGRITYVSPAVERITGYRPEEMNGRDFQNFVSESDIPKAVQAFTGVAGGGSIEGLQMEALRKNGSLVHVEANASPILRGGELVGMQVIYRDITERKLAEEEVVRLSNAVKTATDAIIISDCDGKIVDVNEATLRIYGVNDKRQFIGKSSLDFVAPEDRERALTVMQQAAERGYIQESEYHVVNKDGSRLTVAASRSLVKDADDKPIGFVAIMRDITARKQMEETLRESERRYRLLAENVTDVITGTDMKTLQPTYMSPSVTPLLGYSVEEALARTLEQSLTPASCEVAMEAFAKEMALELEGRRDDLRPRTRELEFYRKDGSTVWVEVKVSFLRDSDGRPVEIVSVLRDITQRKRTEEELIRRNRELAALNAIATTVSQSLELNEILSNALNKVLEIMGVHAAFIFLIDTEQDELVLQVHHGLSPRFVKGVTRMKMGEGLAGEIAQSGRFISVEDISNEPRVSRKEVVKAEGLGAFAGVALNAKDKIVGVLCVMSKERKRILPLDMQLLETIGNQLGIAIENAQLMRDMVEIETLRKLDRLKSQLLSTVSHELRTPLATIKGYATMLLDYDQRLAGDEKREYLGSVDRATDRLTELIDHLLDMSRLESGQMRIERARTDVTTLIRDALGDIQLRSPGHRVTVKTKGKLPTLNVDRRRVRQVLDNLLDNAIKYSDEGTKVAVTAQVRAGELLVGVADEGIGIPEVDLERVFDRMYRIEHRLMPETRGAGLGLAICKGLVEVQGGKIWVESEVGKGSTFYFTVPLDIEEGHSHGEEA